MKNSLLPPCQLVKHLETFLEIYKERGHFIRIHTVNLVKRKKSKYIHLIFNKE